jgi:hypothetical protein
MYQAELERQTQEPRYFLLFRLLDDTVPYRYRIFKKINICNPTVRLVYFKNMRHKRILRQNLALLEENKQWIYRKYFYR